MFLFTFTLFPALPCIPANLTAADSNGLVDGQAQAGPFVFQNTATYTCKSGYAFCTGCPNPDSITVLCQANQQWNDSQPVCYSESDKIFSVRQPLNVNSLFDTDTVVI